MKKTSKNKAVTARKAMKAKLSNGLINAAPEIITAAKHAKGQQFRKWLESVPKLPGKEKPIAVPVMLTLRQWEWFYLAEGAAVNGITIDGAASLCIDSGVRPIDWSNADYKVANGEAVRV